MARDRVQMLVVRGEDRQDAVGLLGDRAEGLDEGVFVVQRVGGEARLRIARAQAERVGPVVDRQHPQPLTSE